MLLSITMLLDTNNMGARDTSPEHKNELVRPFVILRILRPRIFESNFRDHCAKKLDGALRKPTSFV